MVEIGADQREPDLAAMGVAGEHQADIVWQVEKGIGAVAEQDPGAPEAAHGADRGAGDPHGR